MEIVTEPNLGISGALGEHGAFPDKPRTTGEIIFGLGREWLVSSDEFRIKGKFEEWVRRNAKKTIREAELAGETDQAEKMLSIFMSDAAAGYYSWGGKYIVKARNDWPGVKYFLFLLLKRCNPDITEEQTSALLDENFNGCAAAIRWAEGNWQAPAPVQAGANRNGKTKEATLDTPSQN